jgi:hypothetical protein
MRTIERALPFSYGDCLDSFGFDPRITGFSGNGSVAGAGIVDYVVHPGSVDVDSLRESDAQAKEAWKA